MLTSREKLLINFLVVEYLNKMIKRIDTDVKLEGNVKNWCVLDVSTDFEYKNFEWQKSNVLAKAYDYIQELVWDYVYNRVKELCVEKLEGFKERFRQELGFDYNNLEEQDYDEAFKLCNKKSKTELPKYRKEYHAFLGNKLTYPEDHEEDYSMLVDYTLDIIDGAQKSVDEFKTSYIE